MFTIDELSIIKMYAGFKADRNNIVSALKDSLPFIEDPEIRETVESTIRKANAMTEEAFAALDLSQTLLASDM